MQFRFEIAAALRSGGRAGATTTAAPEQVSEDVAEAAAVGLEPERSTGTIAESARTETTGTETAAAVGTDPGRDHLADFVILRALRCIAEHVVGRRDLLEPLFRG